MVKAIKCPYCKKVFINADYHVCPFCKKPLYMSSIFRNIDNPLKDIFDSFGGPTNEEN